MEKILHKGVELSVEDRELIIAAVACGMNSAMIHDKLGFGFGTINEVCRTASIQIEKAWRAADIRLWSAPGVKGVAVEAQP